MLSAPYAFAAAPSNLDLATTLGSLVLVIGAVSYTHLTLPTTPVV